MSFLRSVHGWVVLVSLSVLAGAAVSSGGCSPAAGPSGSNGGSTGTGGAAAHCTGTPRACAGLDDFDCVTTNGCNHTGVCQGTALDCSFLSASGCLKQPGCSVVPGSCSGTAQQCFNFGIQQTCQQQQGCFWDANNFFCSGNPTPCQNIPGGNCGSQIGCTTGQASGCAGTPAACGTLMEKTGCEGEIGCVWVSVCGGTPTACETFSDADCRYQPGCTCEGCETSTGGGGAGGSGPCVVQADCDPAKDPCRTGDCINGECIKIPNCQECVKQIDCDPHVQPCLTGNCIDQKCQAIEDCQQCSDGSQCSKAVNECFTGTCDGGKCGVITACTSGDGCCPQGCFVQGDTDCP